MNDRPPSPRREIHWLIYARPSQVASLLASAASGAGLEARIDAVFSHDRTGARMRVAGVAGPGAAVPTGAYAGEVVYNDGNNWHKIAAVRVGDLPRDASELSVEREALTSMALAPDWTDKHWDVVTARWGTFVDGLPKRLGQVGIAFDDMEAPDFKGPRRPGGDDALAVRKPSERSMWVDPIFRERDVPPREDLCFVLMPFLPDLTRFYEAAVKPVVQEFGLECRRADDITAGQTDIFDDIWVSLLEARFLITDLTGHNPNVYYELGIAHTLGKRVIAIHREEDASAASALPFDVRVRRTIFYKDTAGGAEEFKRQLRAHIQTILGSNA